MAALAGAAALAPFALLCAAAFRSKPSGARGRCACTVCASCAVPLLAVLAAVPLLLVTVLGATCEGGFLQRVVTANAAHFGNLSVLPSRTVPIATLVDDVRRSLDRIEAPRN